MSGCESCGRFISERRFRWIIRLFRWKSSEIHFRSCFSRQDLGLECIEANSGSSGQCWHFLYYICSIGRGIALIYWFSYWCFAIVSKKRCAFSRHRIDINHRTHKHCSHFWYFWVKLGVCRRFTFCCNGAFQWTNSRYLFTCYEMRFSAWSIRQINERKIIC